MLHVVCLSSRPERLCAIADRFNLDQEIVLNNILYARAYTSDQQHELLDYAAAKFYEEPGVFKLVRLFLFLFVILLYKFKKM